MDHVLHHIFKKKFTSDLRKKEREQNVIYNNIIKR
jgi:hypothetical protein